MARERYLLDQEEEAINKADSIITANTPKAKWDNFWYYHKWHILIAVLAALVAAYFVYDVVSRVKPDYQVMLITENGYYTDATDALAKEMEKYGEDLNSDGKVVVQIVAAQVGSASATGAADPNVQAAGVVRLQADLSDGTSMLFLTDQASFQDTQEKLHVFSYLDGTTPAENATDYDRMRVSLKDCKKLSGLAQTVPNGMGDKLLNDLGLSIRAVQGTQLSKQQSKLDYYAASKKLLDKMTADK